MALHQLIQRLLLLGVRLNIPAAPPEPKPPAQLQPLIALLSPTRRAFDERAIDYGHRYRSGFWAIYVLSAFAVLFAVLPLALGWDDNRHVLHPITGLWAVGELALILTIGAIYWLGHRRDWQGEWLKARTTAELTAYLPLVAPLVDFRDPEADPNWYTRVFDPGHHVAGAEDIDALCGRAEAPTRAQLAGAWKDPAFVVHYGRWVIDVLEGQQHYHHRIAARQHALLHRVHAINNGLFGLTAIGAALHLMVHTLWLSLVTTFFPALAASLHGALAQSEAYRLAVTSERLVGDLGAAVARIRALLDQTDAAPSAQDLRATVEEAVAIILQEHEDWHMLVRPHRLSLG